MKKIVFLILLSFIFIHRVHAQSTSNIFVAPYGNDSNPGTLELPLKTIEAAQLKVRQVNKNMTSHLYVYLRGGTYRITKPIVFTPEDSGSNGFFVVYANYASEVPELNGGIKITNWVKEGTKWKAPLPANITAVYPRQFYVNGIRAVRARSEGNSNSAYRGTYSCATPDLCGYIAGATSIASWKNLSDIEFVGINAWKMARCGVNAVTNGIIAFKQPCISNSREGAPFNVPLQNWVENAYELLDQPGEWYLDRTTGYIYYIPRNTAETTDMNAQDAELPVLESIITGGGTPSNLLKYIHFSGINFAYTTWTIPNTGTGFVEVQANFPYGVTRIPGGISLSNTSTLVFAQLHFRHLGSTGLDLSDTVQSANIIANHMYDISATGLQVGNINDPHQTDPSRMVSNNSITNNVIENVTKEFQSGVGIFIGYSRYTQLLHNIIHDVNYTGISSGWGWFQNVDGTYAGNNKIQYNYIYNYALSVFDVGGLYSLGQQIGSEYSNNYIATGIDGAEGLYIDDGSRGIYIHNNVSIATHNQIKGGDHTVANNWWTTPPQISQYNQGLPSYYGITCSTPGYTSLCTWGNIGLSNNATFTDAAQIPASMTSNIGLEKDFAYVSNVREPVEVIQPTMILSNTQVPIHPGDANGDNAVNGSDFVIWLNHYGQNISGSTNGDFNNSGKVDGADFVVWLNNYGK